MSKPLGIGRYAGAVEVGRGEGSTTYVAIDPDLNRKVALEVSAPGVEAEARFVEEARTTGRLEHPGVVPVHELGRTDSGLLYLTTRAIGGRGLDDVLSSGNPADASRRARLLAHFLRACDAVAFAHDRGALHGDLRPANVRLGDFGEVVVVGWGRARVSAYSSPESARQDSGRVDARSDVYSLGAVLYHILTGTPPHIETEDQELLRQVLRGRVEPPRRRAPAASVPAELDRVVALKVLLPGARAGDREMLKFLVEAQVTGQLEHPAIPPVHELGFFPDGRPYFAMKRIRGRGLDEILERPPDRLRLLAAFLKVCEAVAYAHSRGVIHRDLKPANVMVGEFGEVLVVDWGLARVSGTEDPFAGSLSVDVAAASATRRLDPGALVTLDGTIVGTPAYMPPEQADGRIAEIDERSDVYSLGAILYQILTGLPPYRASDPWATLDLVLEGKLAPPSRRAPEREVPRELEAIVLRAMARRPEDRYRSAALLGSEVSAVLEGRPVRAARYGLFERLARWTRRHRASSLAAGAVIAVALLLAGANAILEARGARLEEAKRRERALAAEQAIARGREDFLRSTPQDAAALLEPNGEPRSAAISAFHAAASALAESLEDRIALGGDVEPLREELSAMSLEAARVAAGLGEDLLARLWVERAFSGDLPGADRDEALATIDALRRDRIAASLAGARDVLDRLAGGAGSEPRWFELAVDRILRVPGRELVELLLDPRYLESDSEWVRRAAIEALGRIGDPTTVGPAGKDAVEALGALLLRTDPELDIETAVSIARALGLLADPRAHGPLARRRFQAGLDSAFGRRAAAALSRIPDPEDARADLGTAGGRDRRGLVRGERGDLAGAIEDFTRALELDPGHDGALRHRAASRLAAGDVGGALADLDRALALHPDDADSLVDRAAVLRQAGRLEEARAGIDRAIGTAPSRPEPRIERGLTRWHQGDLEGAREDLDRAVEIVPPHPAAYTNRGILRARCGELAGALEDLDRAIVADPRAGEAHAGRGAVLVAMGRSEEAVSSFTRALELEPRRAHWFLSRGKARFAARDARGASRDIDRAIDLEPAMHEAYAVRAQIREGRSRSDAALADLRRAVELAPGVAAYRIGLAGLFGRLDSPGAAEEEYTRALAIDPRLAIAYGDRALARIQLGKFAAAIDDATRALELEPRWVLAFVRRAAARREAGDPAGAAGDAEAALAIEATSWQAWTEYGRALAAAGERTRAIEALARARELAPRPDQASLDSLLESTRRNGR